MSLDTAFGPILYGILKTVTISLYDAEPTIVNEKCHLKSTNEKPPMLSGSRDKRCLHRLIPKTQILTTLTYYYKNIEIRKNTFLSYVQKNIKYRSRS